MAQHFICRSLSSGRGGGISYAMGGGGGGGGAAPPPPPQGYAGSGAEAHNERILYLSSRAKCTFTECDAASLPKCVHHHQSDPGPICTNTGL